MFHFVFSSFSALPMPPEELTNNYFNLNSPPSMMPPPMMMRGPPPPGMPPMGMRGPPPMPGLLTFLLKIRSNLKPSSPVINTSSLTLNVNLRKVKWLKVQSYGDSRNELVFGLKPGRPVLISFSL